MIIISLHLESATMAELREFVSLTEELPANYMPFTPDYSLDHPAMLTNEMHELNNNKEQTNG